MSHIFWQRHVYLGGILQTIQNNLKQSCRIDLKQNYSRIMNHKTKMLWHRHVTCSSDILKKEKKYNIDLRYNYLNKKKHNDFFSQWLHYIVDTKINKNFHL